MFTTMYAWEYPLVDKDDAYNPTGLDGKPEMVIKQENARALEDCGIVCRFSRSFMTPERFEGLFDADYEDLLAVGSRVVDLERHFNNQRGIDRADDTLPYSLPDFEAALDEYYERRGWTDDGVVPEGRVDVAVSAD
jgi:aldehyde:ferredoxin oxidoreductase